MSSRSRIGFLMRARRIAKEYRKSRGTMSRFYRLLCDAIMEADAENTEKLSQSYPELVHILKHGTS